MFVSCALLLWCEWALNVLLMGFTQLADGRSSPLYSQHSNINVLLQEIIDYTGMETRRGFCMFAKTKIFLGVAHPFSACLQRTRNYKYEQERKLGKLFLVCLIWQKKIKELFTSTLNGITAIIVVLNAKLTWLVAVHANKKRQWGTKKPEKTAVFASWKT